MSSFKKTAALLCAALVMCTSGCSAASTAFGSAEGHDGKLSLKATAENGRFTLSVEHSEETAGIGSCALELLVGEINARQSLAVDVVSGATVTSLATIEAAEKALKKTGFDIDDLRIRAEISDIVKKNLYCDVLVIGAGGAGLTAAISAAENGAEVILIEKMGIAGGTTARSDGKIMAAGTAIQRYNIITDSSSGLASFLYTYGGESVDSSRLLDMAAHSASNLDMLTKYGVRFSNRLLPAYEGQEPERIHLISNGTEVGGGYLIEPLIRAAQANGVEIYYNTEAYSLLCTTTNIVQGAKARDGYGNILTINATSTIIATGGYDRNAELVSELASVDIEDVVSLTANGSTGDGILLAKQANANIIDGALIAELEDYHGDTNGDYSGILVNEKGERFADESADGFSVTGAFFENGGGRAYYICDRAGRTQAFGAGIESKDIIEADSIETLMGKTGMFSLASTVTQYNGMCEKGEDTEFHKAKRYLNPIDDGPFYAVPYGFTAYGTTGGIETNISGAVLADYGIIEGLYAAGEVANGVYYGANYPGFGASLAQAVESGRVAGAYAAGITERLREDNAKAAELAELAPIERPYTLYPFKYYY